MFIFDAMAKHIFLFSLVLACLFVFKTKVNAQDVHYTQYSFLPMLHSPANAGFFDENFRFSAIYRNQWASVPVNYNSIGASFDANFLPNFKTGSKFGAGFNFYFDQAGDSKFQTLHAMVPIAYHLYIPIKDHKLKVSLGVEAGIQYKALSTSELYYDSQFNGEVYNPDAEPNEEFNNLNVMNADFGSGINFEFETDKKLKFGLGFAVKHINNAKEAYLNSNLDPTLRKRFVVPAYVYIPLGNKFDVNVSYQFNEQNGSQEHLTGLMFGYYFQNLDVFKKKINIGAFYRVKDAPSIVVQYETNQFKIGLSYDITASDFARATNTYGGVELGATYLIKNIEKPNLKLNKKCYTF